MKAPPETRAQIQRKEEKSKKDGDRRFFGTLMEKKNGELVTGLSLGPHHHK